MRFQLILAVRAGWAQNRRSTPSINTLAAAFAGPHVRFCTERARRLQATSRSDGRRDMVGASGIAKMGLTMMVRITAALLLAAVFSAGMPTDGQAQYVLPTPGVGSPRSPGTAFWSFWQSLAGPPEVLPQCDVRCVRSHRSHRQFRCLRWTSS